MVENKPRNRERDTGPLPAQQGSGIREVLFLVLLLLCVALLRLRLLDVPLERDEGGFAYMGRLILQGGTPYVDAYDFKPPGLYIAYAAIMRIFGESARGIHIGLLLIDLVTTALVFIVARRRCNATSALTAATVWGVLSTAPGVLGFAAHATHFVVLWTMAGIALLPRPEGKENILRTLAAGCCFGLALLMKQPGIFFFLFGLFAVTLPGAIPLSWRVRLFRAMRLVIGAVIPVIIAFIWLWLAGALRQFVYWNLQYGLEFGGRIGLAEAPAQLFGALPRAAGAFLPVWVLAAAALVFAVTGRGRAKSHVDLLLFALCSAAAVSAGFQFRSHYFIMALPAFALAAGIGVSLIGELRMFRVGSRLLPHLLIAVALLYGIVANRDYYFAADPTRISQNIYFPNPFTESAVIGEYLREHTQPSDRIAVLGSEPELLVSADRRSASPFLFMYFFTEPHPNSLAMEQEMSAAIEQSRPPYFIYVNQPLSWALRPNSERHIFGWMRAYVQEHYTLEGVADIVSPGQTLYRWGNEARTYPRATAASILIFRWKG